MNVVGLSGDPACHCGDVAAARSEATFAQIGKHATRMVQGYGKMPSVVTRDDGVAYHVSICTNLQKTPMKQTSQRCMHRCAYASIESAVTVVKCPLH